MNKHLWQFPNSSKKIIKKLIKKQSHKAGLPPGSLVHIGDQKVDKVSISVIDYTETNLNILELNKIEEVFAYKDSESITWINITGLHDVGLLEKLAKAFEIHPLVMEDVLNTDHRSKVEEYDNFLFVVLKMLSMNEQQAEIIQEHLSLILGKGFVITFQEKAGDIFDPLRERLKKQNSRIRKSGSDYLAYAIIDIIVDHYFILLELLNEKSAGIEERSIADDDKDLIKELQHLKRDIIFIRKHIWPMRETANRLSEEEFLLISPDLKPFLRDVYDHSNQIVDSVETLDEIITGIFDFYHSSMSFKMNEVMKVLTIIATIFIPLTFIAGIYGMNFEVMPELHWRWGYPAVWFLMTVIFVGMVIYFKRKKWF
jgi:magnesium transporter